MAEVRFWEETTGFEEMLSLSVLLRPWSEATAWLESSMVVGVHLDLGPKKRMQSMDDPTDAEMAKEGLGLMTCTVFRVSQ